MVEAFFGGENHGYLTFRSNAQAVAARTVNSATLGTVAPPPGRLPAAVHCVHYDVMCGLTVYTRHDAPAEGRREALPTQAAPALRSAPLTEADVRRLIADAVGQPPRVAPTQARLPTKSRQLTLPTMPCGPCRRARPPPARLARQPMPPSRGPDRPQPKGPAAAPELQQRRPVAPADSPTPKTTGMDGRGSRLRRRLPAEAGKAPSPRPGRSPARPARASGVADAPRSGPPECPLSTGVELSQDLMELDPPTADQQPAPADA